MKSRFSASAKTSPENNKVGVLLTNLGSPDAPTAKALRVYLREFLSDPRVVEIPRLIWLCILHGIILRIRPAKSAKLYESIWQDEGAPLITISQKQQKKIQQILTNEYGDNVVVELAMRYGNPSISSALRSFQQQGISHLVILPLYPQYASPTTGSTFDALSQEIKQWRWVPTLHFLSGYHTHKGYISALANSVIEHINEHGVPDKLVLSYHGMPEAFREWGDPYYDMCIETTSLLLAELMQKTTLLENNIMSTFQSRFGKAPWLQPYTDETLSELPAQGNKHIAILSPAFSADCLETLEELVHENREIFIEAGGEQYHYITALNDRDDHVNALADVIKPSLYSIKK
ncbi:ferrochelatase [Litorilituus lipolyticus]|uniref:Ferrochelatase n=1 Tax=Litorilituus lipolyticus TaxID=2491017 RepID=A0A502LHV6_9GAMM|nr:ferrochelatase [Litorilituus lipolyticus]TPH19357.1 ferrochelatase [Litorilituus lipolyticus]